MSNTLPAHDLAVKQMDRYQAFCEKNPGMDRLDRRHAFFGQFSEMEVSYSIVSQIDSLMPVEGRNRPPK